MFKETHRAVWLHIPARQTQQLARQVIPIQINQSNVEVNVRVGYDHTLPGQPTGGGYFTITNAGKTADTLIGASSVAARSVTLHQMKMNGSVMEMRALPQGIDIPAGGTVTLAPHGLHLMFEKVTAPFKAGASVTVTLSFAKAGKVDVALPVGAINATGPN